MIFFKSLLCITCIIIWTSECVLNCSNMAQRFLLSWGLLFLHLPWITTPEGFGLCSSESRSLSSCTYCHTTPIFTSTCLSSPSTHSLSHISSCLSTTIAFASASARKIMASARKIMASSPLNDCSKSGGGEVASVPRTTINYCPSYAQNQKKSISSSSPPSSARYRKCT